jgi:hypothetical protein
MRYLENVFLLVQKCICVSNVNRENIIRNNRIPIMYIIVVGWAPGFYVSLVYEGILIVSWSSRCYRHVQHGYFLDNIDKLS